MHKPLERLYEVLKNHTQKSNLKSFVSMIVLVILQGCLKVCKKNLII